MPNHESTGNDLIAEIAELRLRLEEAEETLEAIRNGEVDALVVSGPQDDQVYTLNGSDRAYRILFETMNEGAAILGSDGTVFFCNGKLTAMLRTPMETILGGSIFPFVTEKCAPLVADLLERALHSPQKMEITLKSHDGTLIPCQISSSPFLVEDAANICAIFTDLTERKQVEANLIRSNKDLAQFAYVASHDLQEPLRNVIKLSSNPGEEIQIQTGAQRRSVHSPCSREFQADERPYQGPAGLLPDRYAGERTRARRIRGNFQPDDGKFGIRYFRDPS